MIKMALWTFFGFVTPAGNRAIQKCFDDLPEETRDEIRDVLRYHEVSERHLWRRPAFDELGGEGISEFRFVKVGYRMYGDFGPPGRHNYTFLWPAEKRVKSDRHAKDQAKRRNGQLERGEASVDVFEWKEDPD